jgi:hypothetical protein
MSRASLSDRPNGERGQRHLALASWWWTIRVEASATSLSMTGLDTSNHNPVAN